MMKKMSIKILSVLCIFVIVFSMFNVVAYADDGKFVLLSISGYNDDGEESVNSENVFYIRNNILYAPIKLFEDYTMYDYDETNSAFVRAGQEYKKSNSKVIFNYEDATMDVFYTDYQKETYDLDFYQFGDTYFFPLDEMAAYLKSSIVYKSGDTISILSSGVSLSDALYNYEPLSSCLDYDDLVDDIFAGNKTLFKAACVLGYFGETVFSFKITNLLGDYGDYKKYLDILESAVTNNEPYEQLLNNDNLLSDLLGVTDELYNEVYKKATTIYKLSSNSVTTMFEDFKSLNSFGDESPFDNFFPEEQLEIDKINSLSKYISTADLFIDIVDFYHKFYTMNQDNKDAIELFGSINDYDTRALALSEISGLYGNDVVESAATKMRDEISKELLKEYAGEVAKEFMSGANKVKLATSIVNSVFKAMGFDLSDNSGYDVMLASQLKHFVLNTIDGGSIDLNTENDCSKLRLTLILGMLIDIQSYKMGNKFAAKYDAKGIYNDEIDEANKRLALFYLAKDSEKYDSVEGIEKISKQNKKQISKLDFTQLKEITETEAIDLLRYTDDISLMNEQTLGLSTYEIDGVTLHYFSKNGFTYKVIRDDGLIKSETFTDYNGEQIELGHSACIEKINDNTGEKEIIIDDYDGQLIVTDHYIYYTSMKYKQGKYYNDCYDGVNYVRTDLNGENKEIIYHDEYRPFGSSIGGSPTFLVTNEYMYVSKYNIVRIDLETKEKEIVCNIDINELTGSDWIDLNFVFDDTYYFSLADNQQSEPENENLPDICYGFFKYNVETGLDYIIEIDSEYADSYWRDNGDGTKTMQTNSNYLIKMKGLESIKLKDTELPDEYNFSYKTPTPFSETGIYFTQENGKEYFYSFDSNTLELI